jgi:hypothetical protein
VSQFGDPLQMAITIARFALGSLYTLRILHLEGEEVFGFIKQKKNLPPRSEGNLHRHNHVNFSCPRVEFTLHNFAPNGNVRQSKYSQEVFLVLTHNGEEVLECLCGDDIWHIERCNPKSNAQCSTLQKDAKHYCKAKIISRGT